jgi:hypothetical protein
MAVKHKAVHSSHHQIFKKVRKAIDKIEDEIAEKVVHEMKEHHVCEPKHSPHKRGCGCKTCKGKRTHRK